MQTTDRTISPMKKIVVDSSVIVKWVNSQNEKNIAGSDRLLEDCKNGAIKLFAPELAKYEVGNALWKKGLDTRSAKISLGTIFAGPVEFVRLEEPEALRTMEISTGAKMTYYDASFVALTESLGAILVTDNLKHQGKFRKVKTISLADYDNDEALIK